MLYFIWIEITILTLLCGVVRATEQDRDEFEARAGIGDNLSETNAHPRLGDIPTLNRKVIKGQRVTIREHPYVASVRRLFAHYISGAILSRNLIVSVAHPLYNVPITELGVVLGENYSDRGSTVMTVVLIVIHPHFDPNSLQNDITILRTYEEFSYRGAIKPIRLITPSDSLNERKAFVTGWGRCDNMGSELCLARSSTYFPKEKQDPMLRTVSFTIIHPHERCKDYKRYDITLYPGMLCLGESREDSHACPCLGSPGALLVSSEHLVGIQSWGFGCGYIYDLPLVYTDMQYYTSWILQNIVLLRSIRQHNLTSLFQATKAAILSEWLLKTRYIKPTLKFRTEKSMERLDIDMPLVKINGTVYDVRDFIFNGFYREDKKYMYEHLRQLIENENTKVSKSTVTTSPIELKPFLGEDALSIAYNNNEFSSTIRDENVTSVTIDVPAFRTQVEVLGDEVEEVDDDDDETSE